VRIGCLEILTLSNAEAGYNKNLLALWTTMLRKIFSARDRGDG
jgi:hypothetical protein